MYAMADLATAALLLMEDNFGLKVVTEEQEEDNEITVLFLMAVSPERKVAKTQQQSTTDSTCN